jgi:hypothetical protein
VRTCFSQVEKALHMKAAEVEKRITALTPKSTSPDELSRVLVRAANPRGPGGPMGPLCTPLRTPGTLPRPSITH